MASNVVLKLEVILFLETINGSAEKHLKNG